MKKKTFEMTLAGETIKFEDKSHAGIFRQFWAYFMEQDIDKTIETVEEVGIRISDNKFFVAKNGSKKRNIFVKDNYYIYTHLTPKAMEKAYEKFIKGWEGTYQQVEKTEQKAQESQKSENKEPAEKKLTERQRIKLRAKEVAERRAAEKRAQQEAKEKEKIESEKAENNEQLTAEELENVEL